MKANSDKFKYIIFHRNTEGIKTKLKFGEIELENLEHVKLIGVYLDRKLLFNHHINTIVNKAQKSLFVLLKIRKYLNQTQAMLLAKMFVLSNFKYCNLIWTFCSKKADEEINNIHKRVLRCVYNSPKENLNNLLNKNGDCNIHMLNLQSLMILIYKISKNDSPEITSNVFKFKELSYNLQSKLPIELTKVKTINYGTNTVFLKEDCYGTIYRMN